MDLFGEQSVQVMVAAATQSVIEAALVLTLAALIVLLAARLVQRSAPRPMLAIAPARISRIASPARDDVDIASTRRWLSTSLPSRAPPGPDPSERFCPSPSGDIWSG